MQEIQKIWHRVTEVDLSQGLIIFEVSALIPRIRKTKIIFMSKKSPSNRSNSRFRLPLRIFSMHISAVSKRKRRVKHPTTISAIVADATETDKEEQTIEF